MTVCNDAFYAYHAPCFKEAKSDRPNMFDKKKVHHSGDKIAEREREGEREEKFHYIFDVTKQNKCFVVLYFYRHK